jgi:methylated-DNA-[protein]-cysteine S-methyltransferase
MSAHWTTYKSPIGPLILLARARGLRAIGFPGDVIDLADATREPAALAFATEALDEYFAGARTSFSDLPLDRGAGTAFQRGVWELLLTIPYGETVSYGELARRGGRPDRIRAVGAANGRNPLPIVVPCHRVVGADGRLTGYRGGLGRKRALLDHEGAVAARQLALC